MSRLLPLNLPDHAPRADDPRLRGSLEDLLASVRGKARGWQGSLLISWRPLFGLAAEVPPRIADHYVSCGKHCPTAPGLECCPLSANGQQARRAGS